MIASKTRIPVNENGARFVNPLKDQLLHEIKQNGWLNGVAKNTEISYQHVWSMIDEMNRNTYFGVNLKPKTKRIEEQKRIESMLILNEIKKVVDQINAEIYL
jgi:hypothetical protein